jgi:rhodanese-related sulfurtransferase
MRMISRDDLRDRMERNDVFALIEVLPPQNYEASHLPGAMNIPLGNDFRDRVQQTLPDRSQTIVVYCRDQESAASPHAAKELEAMGYADVWLYAGGKSDWMQAGLHIASSEPSAREASA